MLFRSNVLFHEVAHCLLHFDDRKPDGDMIVDRHDLDTSEREMEAECTAYLVMCSLGLEAGREESRGYIQGWMKKGGKKLTDRMARRIMNTAEQILEAGQVESPKPQAHAA